MKNRVKLSTVVKNQLPEFVRSNYPLLGEFLTEYYKSQEYKGSPIDLLTNIDEYLKLDEVAKPYKPGFYLEDGTNVIRETFLTNNISTDSTNITVRTTSGFPDNYGLIKINNEIITYKSKTENQFIDCIRGLSAIDSWNSKGELIFNETLASSHNINSQVFNLSVEFLDIFLKKIKKQLIPGFNADFDSSIDQNIFIKHSKDFYRSKGTDTSFKILFKALYGENVKVLKPSEYLIKPSSSFNKITRNIVAESIEGNPLDLVNRTLYQNAYPEYGINESYGTVSYVEKIFLEDKEFYNISVDFGYNRDIPVDGTIFGSFVSHPKTKLIGVIESNSFTIDSSIDVDSTLGFPSTGRLVINGFRFDYSSKSSTQFYGINPIDFINFDISDNSDVFLDVYAYGETQEGLKDIKIRISPVINKLNIIDNTYYMSKNDTAKIKSLGFISESNKANNWIFNQAVNYDCDPLVGGGNTLSTIDNNNFRIGDKVKIVDQRGIESQKTIINIDSDKIFTFSPSIPDDGGITKYFTVYRNLLKNDPNENFANLELYTSNVQNTYVKSYNDDVLVSSNSIPYFSSKTLSADRKKIEFYGLFGNPITLQGSTNIELTQGLIDHGFFTGDSIFYSHDTSSNQINLISELTGNDLLEGVYFVQRVDRNTIRLANSLADLYTKKWISVYGNIPFDNKNSIEYYPFYQKALKPQNILRQIKSPNNQIGDIETNPGAVGILINGVEIINYKSTDGIYYGEIKNIEITSPGRNYDVINPPNVIISDESGIGTNASCIPSVIGSLKKINILDPGYDYITDPIVQISGGNGSGAKVKPKMKIVPHIIEFNARLGVKTDTNEIGFSTYHKLRSGEKIVYRTEGLPSISGLVSNSEYYVSISDFNNIKLHSSETEAISGINTVQLISVGDGIQKIQTYESKKVISELVVENEGFGYENKQRIVPLSGISTSTNIFSIKNHGYSDREVIVYNTTGTAISGLTNNKSYIVTKVSNDDFKISEVGVGVTFLNYQNKKYVEINDTGSGTHSFNYEPIRISLIGSLNPSPVTGISFEAKLQPVFRGSINSLQITSGGISYGSSEILNYKKQPLVEFNSGKNAIVQPIVNDGKIKEVLVLNGGSDYNCVPDLVIEGSGNFAKLTPIIENGELVEVKVIDGGIDYENFNTRITVISPGTGCKVETEIQKWTVNLFQKNFASIIPDGDDGFITNSKNPNYELQYVNIYPPRILRESVYAQDSDGNILNGIYDLRKNTNSLEISSINHSPILGWAYDGNPIYGPYAYENADGTGNIVQMISGYEIENKFNRPPGFDLGFFVEDYEYKRSNSTLDKHNGRYCITPDYPNGVYAYFTTLSSDPPSSSGPFRNYKLPEFPYVVGKTFKSIPDEFNLDKNSTQDNFDLNKTDWFRNINPYNLKSNNSGYDYIFNPNKLRENNTEVESVSKGKIESINVLFGGNDYQVGDKIVLESPNESSYGSLAKVTKISGKSIGILTSYYKSFDQVEINPISDTTYIGFSTTNHNFSTDNLVTFSGINTSIKSLEKTFKIRVPNNVLSLSSGIGSTSVTGIVTYLNVNGNLDYPNIRENDILGIGTERVKVLNIDNKSSRIRVIREYDNTVGSGSSYNSSEELAEISRKFYFDSIVDKNYQYTTNKQFYFIPSDSLGIGSQHGVGIGFTINFSNPGVGITQLTIPTKSIFIEKHGLKTGDELIYTFENGSAIEVSTDGISSFSLSNNQKLYVLKISNNLIGICSSKNISIPNSLYLNGNGSGQIHSFKTNYNSINGKVTRNIAHVSLASTSHNLNLGDKIFVSCSPTTEKNIKVLYNDSLRRMVVNPLGFTTSSVNIQNNTIEIPNHGYVHGEKIIHTSSSPCGGLENNKVYYVNVKDENNISLSEFYYQTIGNKIEEVNITSQSFGIISQVNPKINVIRNQIVKFDLSDESLSDTYSSTKYTAFEFDLYNDRSYTNIFESTSSDKVFEVIKNGDIGISTDSYLKLFVSDSLPNTLYYKLTPSNSRFVSDVKKQIYIDNEFIDHNQIVIVDSKFSGEKEITGLGSYYDFEYDLNGTPENISYSSPNSRLEYDTSSISEYGSIKEIKIFNSSDKYETLPGITTIITSKGKDALLEPSSVSIGKITSTRIKNIGFDYPSDNTLRPHTILPYTIKVLPLSSFDEIFVNTPGRNYSQSPNLVVIDKFTDTVVNDVILDYKLGSPKVNIIKNTSGFYGLEPLILPVNNTNGVGISSIAFNNSTKDVIVSLGASFSTGYFPFSIGDKVLIENTSIVGSGKGYNSKDYGYKLFELSEVNPFFGGFGQAYVKFNLSDYLTALESPGTFDIKNTFGRIISENDFPKFKSTLTKNNFLIGETVETTNNKYAVVEKWNKKTELLKTSSDVIFDEGDIIIGKTSKTRGFIQKISSFNSEYVIDSHSDIKYGPVDEIGFLNNSIQRLPDNYYYQQFSYSLNSRVNIEKWSDSVDNLNHTSGFLKFSDYVIESFTPDSINLIPNPSDSTITVVNDIINVVDLEDYPNFDIVTENKLSFGNLSYSNEIIFNTRDLVDYFESVGNRVLTIDDISKYFNSDPRPTPFSAIDNFNLNFIAKKYFIHIKDKTYFDDRQLVVVTLLHDGLNGFINQYGRVETQQDLGYFDFRIFGSDGQLIFYPTKYSVNDYDITMISYDMQKNLNIIGENYNLGNIVNVSTHKKSQFNSPTTIVGISSDSVRTSKILVFLTDQNDNREFDEITLIHNDNNVDYIEYGQLTDASLLSYGQTGFGTYYSYFSGSDLNLDFYPNPGIAVTSHAIAVSVGKSDSAITDIEYLNDGSLLGSSYATIPSSLSSYDTVIASYPSTFESGYFIVSVEDLTNNQYQVSEVIVVNDSSNDPLITEYGVLLTGGTLGEISARRVSSNIELVFTQNPNAEMQVRCFRNALKIIEVSNSPNPNSIDFTDSRIKLSDGLYTGTDSEIKRSFNLYHKQKGLFRRDFSGIDTSVIDIDNNILIFPEHYFVTGEKIKYVHQESLSSPIGIATTTIPGIGSTNVLPNELYVIKVNDNQIQLASTAENALKANPIPLEFTSVGIGSLHYVASDSPNARVLITIDNVIQSPIAGTALTTTLVDNLDIVGNRLITSGLTSFFANDLIKIGSEVMKIDTVGFGSENGVLVKRPWMGTVSIAHSIGETIEKLIGSYNIVDNIIHFSEAPKGLVPSINANSINGIFTFDYDSTTGITTVVTVNNHNYSTGEQVIIGGCLVDAYNGYYKISFSDNIRTFTLDLPQGIVGIPSGNLYTYKPNKGASVNERDWSGIATSSQFTGRSFMKTGLTNTINHTYSSNYIFDDISHDFNSIQKTFTLTSNDQNIIGFSTYNSVVLIDNIFQYPQGTLNTPQNYILSENAGITSITFVGTATSIAYDPNNASIPIGGVIVSVGSSQGFGYQPLVSAGGTAIVSAAGTIQSVSIGNSGSGYRSGIQTNVYVSVANTSEISGITTLTRIGIASISNGSIVSIDIRNSGTGYTASNPPLIFIDSPLSYSNIPLEYSLDSPGSKSGIQATADIIVGQGSSVIDFKINYTGYAYEVGDILTIPTGGSTGLPLSPGVTFNEFQIYVDKIHNHKFNGWNLGELLILDDIDILFDGQRTQFPLSLNGELISIKAKRGSNIDIASTLLVFVNDVLQVPNQGYTFRGGSVITFTEPLNGDINEIPGTGDKCKIIFYRGNGEVDVTFRDILETVKVGDELQIIQNEDTCSDSVDQDDRTVYEIKSTDFVETNLYNGPGINNNLNCSRSVTWKRQRQDTIINGNIVGKDRILYESIINPLTYCLQPISIASTQIYVENVKTFFDSKKEDLDPDFLKNITILSQDDVEVGIITAHISSGIVTGFTILNSGKGYLTAPSISFESPIGISNTYRASGIASISSGSIVDIIITNPGFGYTSPPKILVEPPTVIREQVGVVTYSGDYGLIVGIETSNPIGIANTVISFDLFVPPDSPLRQESVMGVGMSKTVSSLKVNDYFVVKNTLVGSGVTSLRIDGSVLGIGNSFLDNVYQVIDSSNISKEVLGYGNTSISRIFVSVSDYNSFVGIASTTIFGEYSWGLVDLNVRKNPKGFNSYLNNGLLGLTTSAVVQRTIKLKYKDYLP